VTLRMQKYKKKGRDAKCEAGSGKGHFSKGTPLWDARTERGGGGNTGVRNRFHLEKNKKR